MKVQILSDIHVEFHGDGGRGFVESRDARGVDVLVVAGDLGLERDGSVKSTIEGLCARYPRVVFVAGNHEYYGSSRERVRDLLHGLEDRLPTFSWLDDGAVDIDGVRFIGSTLWFPPHDASDAVYARFLNDFRAIEGFSGWVHEANRASAAFLGAAVRPGDVVVTHHLPHPACVAPRWAGDPLNRFFVCPLPDALVSRPRLWIFGHTHDSIWTSLGGCRLVANPYGYKGVEENPSYGRLVLDLDDRTWAPRVETG